jgi:hypothetical protein
MPQYGSKKDRVHHRRVELRPVGVDGSAVVTQALRTGPAVVRFIAVDYISQPATTDLVIKADGTGGDTLFTVTNGNTDITPKPVSLTGGIDEGGAALAATDGSAGGWPVKDGLFFDVAQGDGQTTGDEAIIVDVWYEECAQETVTLIAQSGADGTGAVTRTLDLHRAGIIRAIKVDYQNMPATTDILIKDKDTDGTTLLTLTNNATDIALSPVGMPGVNESNAALAATDASDGGWPFKSKLFFDVAQADIFTGGNEKIVIDLWIDV